MKMRVVSLLEMSARVLGERGTVDGERERKVTVAERGYGNERWSL